MKHLLSSTVLSGALALACGNAFAQDYPANFDTGILMLNEGWFGHESGTMSWLSPDGTYYGHVFSALNPGHTFGNTNTMGDIYGDKLYVVSKQTYQETGGRLTVMDASTLKYVSDIKTLPGGGDGRGFCVVNNEKAYISTNNGIFAINPVTLESDGTNLSTVTKQCGELLRYGNYVFGAVQNTGVLAINIDTDEATMLEIASPMGFIVTGTGDLYAATLNANAEFVKINPETLELREIDIEGSHCIANEWGTWHPTKIAATLKGNKVFYGTGGWSVSSIVSYDFDTEVFDDKAFILPGKSTGLDYDQQVYGQIAIDPVSGLLVIPATEAGYGTHYMNNWMYFVNTESGEIEQSVTLPEGYWFPLQPIFPDFDAPVLDVPAQSIDLGCQEEIALPDFTTLRAGNPHFILYSVKSDDTAIADAEIDSKGNVTVSAVGEGATTLNVSASFKGRSVTVEVPVTVSVNTGLHTVSTSVNRDVYSATGVLILRNATEDRISTLSPGLYIIGGKKTLIK